MGGPRTVWYAQKRSDEGVRARELRSEPFINVREPRKFDIVEAGPTIICLHQIRSAYSISLLRLSGTNGDAQNLRCDRGLRYHR